MKFKKVCIVGCGLIGSSIARAIRKNRLSSKIVSSNRSDIINKKVITMDVYVTYKINSSPSCATKPTKY